MNLQQIQNKYIEHPEVIGISNEIRSTKNVRLHLSGVSGSLPTLIFSALQHKLKQQFLIILNDREEAAYFFDDLNTLKTSSEIVFYPSSFKGSLRHGKPDQENIVMRTDVLNRISENKPLIIISYPEALLEKVITSDTLKANTLKISVKEKLSIDFIGDVLFEYGFERVDFVFEPGQYAVRGGIIDIFSFANEKPFRVDFFGDEVDSIRSFEIETQLSENTLETISIIPNIQHGLENEQRIDFISYLSLNTILAFSDIEFVADQMDKAFLEIKHDENRSNQADTELIHLRSDILYQGKKLLNDAGAFTFIGFGLRTHFTDATVFKFVTTPQPKFNKNFDLLAQEINHNKVNGYHNFILSTNEKQIERLQAIFDDRDHAVNFEPLNFTFHEGFIDKDLQLAFYTDHQIFERYHRFKMQGKRKAQEAISIKELNKLHPGDYVVHIDHGIGKFAGLVKSEVNGKVQESIRLVYRDNDSLLVNIHSLHRISKYKGKDGGEPKINKLGSQAWQNMKNRTKKKVKDIAKDLIALYAVRLKEKGFAFTPDTYLQQELEASFIYEDTPDQLKSTEAIKADMEKQMPMDRLVCGDVGFGKTEIAIRAAFKAVTDSKQVAVLVPTTILAFQHFKTFSERLKDFPVKVGYISRLRKAADIKETLKELSEGKIDIIIGTHKLVSKDVKFKDLGLLIIDEEQKFGVTVKEKLKQLKVNVDTLTLTATPIPRTLQFSLMGARDLSIIQTPPPNRYPILTEVHGFNEKIIKEAIEYEIDRGGQVFFIHNRVHNIYEVETLIQRICPGIKTVVGHGQMDGQKLEKVMLDFIAGEFDVLIATTIIESGLDIPNTNTIIINHAQNFGLSDLHQLRGRVGRSNKKAFCYLLAPPMSSLTPEARRRMKAIEEFSELGSGFNIAMQDLDIRGAGNLLGAEQSGFVADIGYETFHRILEEAVLELKQEEFKYVFDNPEQTNTSAFTNIKFVNDCTIDTDLEMRFPESYINSMSERMALYRELDNVKDNEQLIQMENNLTDRFGKIPNQVSDLIDVVRMRWIAIEMGIEKIILKNGIMICHFVADQQSPFYQSPAFTQLLTWFQKNPDKAKMKEARNKLSLVFHHVKSVKKAHENLTKIIS